MSGLEMRRDIQDSSVERYLTQPSEFRVAVGVASLGKCQLEPLRNSLVLLQTYFRTAAALSLGINVIHRRAHA